MRFWWNRFGGLAEAIAPAALWKALWPVLLGGGLFAGLLSRGQRLPQVPEGDVVMIAARASRSGLPLADALEHAEGILQRWPVAGIALLALMLVLGVTIGLD